MSDEPESKTADWPERLKLWLAIIGIISPLIALATFIGLKPEKQKALQWEYVAQTVLVNPSLVGHDENIKVYYDGREIKQLTTVIGRLTNSGDLPITDDRKDIEQPAQLTFPANVKVINATITAKTNVKGQLLPTLKAASQLNDNTLTILHGLLNPGDSISVQVIVDGDLGPLNTLPTVTYRIADIAEPITKFPTDRPKIVRAAYFQLSQPWVYAVVIVATLLPIVLLIIAVVALIDFITDIFPGITLKTLQTAIDRALHQDALLARLKRRSYVPPLQDIVASEHLPGNLDWISNPAEFDQLVNKVGPQNKDMTIASLQRLAEAIRDSLPKEVAASMYEEVSSPLDRQFRFAIRKMQMNPDESVRDFLTRVRQTLDGVLRAPLSKRFMEAEQFTLGLSIVSLVLGITSGMVLAGTWNLLMVGS